MGSSGISWTMCKSFAPLSRQITTPVPHDSIFLQADALPDSVVELHIVKSSEPQSTTLEECHSVLIELEPLLLSNGLN